MTEDESDMCWELLMSIGFLVGNLHYGNPYLSNKDIQDRLNEASDRFINRWKELDPKGWEEK